MARANQAWFVLRDPARRAAHDARVDGGEARGPGPARTGHPDPSAPDRAMRLLRVVVAMTVLLCITILFLILLIGNAQGPTGL